MPLYPLLIAMSGPGAGQLGADITLSVLSVWLVYALSNQLFADQHARIFSAAAAACYPPFIFFSVVGLSETLFITLILSAFLVLVPRPVHTGGDIRRAGNSDATDF